MTCAEVFLKMDSIENPKPIENAYKKKLSHQYDVNYNWHMVALGLINKYPNFRSRHVHTTDYLSVACDPEGILRIKKLHCKNRTLMMRAFRCMENFKNVFVIEEIAVDRDKRQTHRKSYNLNFHDYGQIIEDYRVYAHLKNKTSCRIIRTAEFEGTEWWITRAAKVFYNFQAMSAPELLVQKLTKIRDAFPFEMLD